MVERNSSQSMVERRGLIEEKSEEEKMRLLKENKESTEAKKYRQIKVALE